jgi:hypothetical protein
VDNELTDEGMAKSPQVLEDLGPYTQHAPVGSRSPATRR